MVRQYRSWPSLHSPTHLPPFQRKEGYLVGFVHALIVIQSEPSRICSRLSVVAACVHISVMHACWPGDEMTRPVSRGPARESNTKPQHQHSEQLYLFTCLNPLINSNRIQRTSKAMQLPLIPCIFAFTLPSIFTTLPSDLHQLHLFSQAASPVICALPVSPVTKRRRYGVTHGTTTTSTKSEHSKRCSCPPHACGHMYLRTPTCHTQAPVGRTNGNRETAHFPGHTDCQVQSFSNHKRKDDGQCSRTT